VRHRYVLKTIFRRGFLIGVAWKTKSRAMVRLAEYHRTKLLMLETHWNTLAAQNEDLRYLWQSFVYK